MDALNNSHLCSANTSEAHGEVSPSLTLHDWTQRVMKHKILLHMSVQTTKVKIPASLWSIGMVQRTPRIQKSKHNGALALISPSSYPYPYPFLPSWSFKRKWAATAIVSSFTFITPVSSSMVAPATDQLAAEFGVHSSVIIAFTTSIFVLAYGESTFVQQFLLCLV